MRITDLFNREALIQAVLEETGLSKEEAVVTLANELGVNLSSVVSDGDEVPTSAGLSQAKILSPDEVATLRKANQIQARLFGA